MTTERRRRRVSIAILIALVAVPCLLSFAWPRREFQALDVTGARWARDFRLPDQDGRLRTLAEFRGSVVLVFFGFTQCPAVCPTALARAADAVRRLGPEGRKVQVLFVTLDPERDTPDILDAYVRAFDPHFLALRGDHASIDATAREFHVEYRRVPTGSSYTLDHTAAMFAFDPHGALRLVVGSDETSAALAGDVRRLLQDGSGA